MSETLPGDWYHDPAIFEIEGERIFRRHWWLVGIAADVADPGDYFALTLMQWPLVIVRDQRAVLRAYYNICRHRAGPLVLDGSGRCREFVCRYHGWRYACSGELLKTPGLEPNDGIKRNAMGLLPVRVESWNGLVFVCLDDDAPGLTDWLGDVPSIATRFDPTDAMQFDGSIEKPARANWKTYADNSCEGYHVGMVHRALGSSMQRESIRIAAYENGKFVGFDVSYDGGDDPSRAGTGFWIYKFPGLLLHFADYAFNAETVFPERPDRLRLRRWFWSNPDKARAHGVDANEIRPNSEKVIDEDIAICELVQRNLCAGVYPGGQLSVSQEPGTVYFQQLVRAALGGCVETTQRGADRG